MSSEARFPRFTVVGGLALVPSALMILTDHPVLGAATLAGVLAAGAAHARMAVHARQAREERMPEYARTTATPGDDPAPVIRQLRQRLPEAPDDRDLFHPDEEGWVHLRPSDW